MQPRPFAPDTLMDANLLKCFSPLYNVLMFLGCSRICIEEQMVTAPSVWQKLYTLLCITAFTFSFCYFEEYLYKTYYKKDATMYMTCLIGTIVQYTSYLCNTIFTRFGDSESVVNLCVKLQQLDNILALKEFNQMKEQQYYWNLIVLVLIIGMFECGYITHAVATVEYPILTVFEGLGLLNVYVDIVLAACLIFYLAIRLRFLNKVVTYNFHVKYATYSKEEPSDPIVVNESFIISADLNDGNLDLEKFLVCLKELLKLYKLITEVFRFSVLNIATTLFLWALLTTLTVITGLRSGLISITVLTTIVLWFVFYFVLIIMLALVSDYFIQEVRQTKLLCIHAMSCQLDGPIWKGTNDILRTIEFYQATFSVYGIFTMDMKLPLSLIGIITTNLVVLIQFTIPNFEQT